MVDNEHEEERGVVPVDDAHAITKDGATLDKVAQGVVPLRDDVENVAYDLLLAILRDILVELGETGLAVVVKDNDVFDHVEGCRCSGGATETTARGTRNEKF